jgi:RNA polymerase sigma-70 factor, ECF subfamily
MLLNKTLDALHRQESGKILAGLIRRIGSISGRSNIASFDIAQDSLQAAFEKALMQWPRNGMPDKPAAWLTTVARNAAMDKLRRDSKLLPDSEALLETLAAPEAASQEEDEATHSGVEDDRLRLIFTCCHPALAPASAAALALRTLCGLTTKEIARAFVEPEATTAQKLVRAKKKIAEARIPYEVPAREALSERLAAVFSVIYLVFNEGYAAAHSASLLRADLCAEAIRLARLLHTLLPGEPECAGLLSLMSLHHARREARADEQGALIPLEEQDRSQWKRDEIAQGTQLLDAALALRKPGPYQIQAAIAALHAQALTPPQTDWHQISALYGALLRHQPTAVVQLNAAVALAMAVSIDQGLQWMDEIAARDESLNDYHLLHAARADLLRRAGRKAEAAEAYERALALVSNEAERVYLSRRLHSLQ